MRCSQRDFCTSCGSGASCPAWSDTQRLLDHENYLEKLKHTGLDRCGYRNGWRSSFCTSLCYNDILKYRISKFSAFNMITCHRYPAELEDLTFVEECVLARRHPIEAILKLRPGNRRRPNNYYALRGHMPGPLLQILPSTDLRFQDIVKVFWIGKCAPSTTDLKSFLEIRKNQVLSAYNGYW
jgi:hypothetical protein